MTKEELDKIARRYAQYELKDNHASVEDIVAAAFLNGIDYAEHHPHWISVEDELPKKDGKYLFYDEILGVQASIYYDGCTLTNSITHWMRIEPPAVLSSLESTEKKWEEKKGGEQ